MEKMKFERELRDFSQNDPGNVLAKDIALKPELAGMRFFDEPLFGYADASDPLFTELKKPQVIDSHYMLPGEWLEGVQTVISFLFPFTDVVKQANGADMSWPALEWLHARIEGQEFIQKLCLYAMELLSNEGFTALMPVSDSRFTASNPDVQDKSQQAFYKSNWSERHTAYICGMGTFGLSGGLISSKGSSGRYASLVTDAFFEPSRRAYTGIKEYCSGCGACISNCPSKAISAEKGKSHPVCSAFLNRTKEQYKPRYGCGKCLTKVPCESKIPLTY